MLSPNKLVDFFLLFWIIRKCHQQPRFDYLCQKLSVWQTHKTHACMSNQTSNCQGTVISHLLENYQALLWRIHSSMTNWQKLNGIREVNWNKCHNRAFHFVKRSMTSKEFITLAEIFATTILTVKLMHDCIFTIIEISV